MKTTISIALVLCLLTTTLPVCAQEPLTTTEALPISSTGLRFQSQLPGPTTRMTGLHSRKAWLWVAALLGGCTLIVLLTVPRD